MFRKLLELNNNPIFKITSYKCEILPSFFFLYGSLQWSVNGDPNKIAVAWFYYNYTAFHNLFRKGNQSPIKMP